MSMRMIRDVYQVPAKRGMKIKYEGRAATIVGTRNARLRIEFDDEEGVVYSAHPTYNIEYPGKKPGSEEPT